MGLYCVGVSFLMVPVSRFLGKRRLQA
jgi:hypothetical protein